jgi:hypothetical protein
MAAPMALAQPPLHSQPSMEINTIVAQLESIANFRDITCHIHQLKVRDQVVLL